MNYNCHKTDENVVIAPGATVVGEVSIGKDSSVWYGAVVRADEGKIVVGARTNLQDLSVLHAKTSIGDGCTVGHCAILHGCTVGDNTLIGMGAIVLNDARIGSNCIIGAGALVTGRTQIPDGSLVLGSPAKVIRALREEEVESNRASAEEYRENAALLRIQLEKEEILSGK